METDTEGVPKPDKEWVQAQLLQRGISQRRLAALLGVDPPTITLTLDGKRRLTLLELKQLSEILMVSVDEILRHWGFSDQHVGRIKVPVIGYVNDDCSVAYAVEPYSKVEAPPEIPRDGRAVQIRSPRATSSIWDGMLCYTPNGVFSPAESIGHLALVQTKDDLAFFGLVSRGYEDGKFNLTHPATDTLRDNLVLVNAVPARWFRAAR